MAEYRPPVVEVHANAEKAGVAAPLHPEALSFDVHLLQAFSISAPSCSAQGFPLARIAYG